MPLDDLVSVIETLQQRIATHRQSLQQNETRTRMALIDPLLTALGWDVADPTAVTPEFDSGDGRADYALLHEGRPAALIEAKHLYEPLERARHQDQVFGYARRSRIKFAGITDGNTWVLEDLSVFEGEPRILDISMENTPASECALKLLMLWRPNLASGQPVTAEEPILVEEPESEPSESQQSTNQAPVPVPVSETWKSLAEYDPAAHTQPPSAIRFEDESARHVQFWYEVLAHTVEWLWTKEFLTLSDIPVASGPKRYIISTEPVHQSGNSFSSPQSVGDLPLWISKHGNKQAMFKRTQVLLQHCGVSHDTVQVKVEQ